MWLPLSFAVSSPSTDLMEILTIFPAQPQAIQAQQQRCNPCLLAAMMTNPRLEVLRRLKVYYPRFGSSVDCCGNTPLHLAARFTDNVAVIRELVQLHPPALK